MLYNIFVGMALGLVLSTVCTSESTALMGAIASFYPTIILSGKYIFFVPKIKSKTYYNDVIITYRCDVAV